ncbi:MAG: hypothetical protein ACI9XJ_000508, partial [Marivirga sp.]
SFVRLGIGPSSKVRYTSFCSVFILQVKAGKREHTIFGVL